jgi:hypothetical protein
VFFIIPKYFFCLNFIPKTELFAFFIPISSLLLILEVQTEIGNAEEQPARDKLLCRQKS